MNQDDHGEDFLPPTEDNASAISEPPKLTVPFEDTTKEFFTGLFETIKLVLVQPTHFFRNYKLDGPIGRPVLFAVMIGWTMAIISSIWGTIINKPIFDYVQEHMPEIEGFDWEKITAASGSSDFILTLILAPIFILFGVFIIAGIYHLFLLMVKGANKNFETTFNVVSYGMSARIAEVIPFCGSLISWIFGMVLAIIGLAEAHKTDNGKAVFAVLVPVLLCCLCIFILFRIIGASGFAALLNKNLQ